MAEPLEVASRHAGRKSLQWQLPLWGAVLVLAALLLFGAAAWRETRNALLAAGRARLAAVLVQLSTLLQESAHQRRVEADTAAAQPALRALLAAPSEATRATARTVLTPLLAPASQSTEILLCDAAGRPVFDLLQKVAAR